MPLFDVDVYFGSPDRTVPDWRKGIAQDDQPDEDEELETTPPDVVGILGFDPKEKPVEQIVAEHVNTLLESFENRINGMLDALSKRYRIFLGVKEPEESQPGDLWISKDDL